LVGLRVGIQVHCISGPCHPPLVIGGGQVSRLGGERLGVGRTCFILSAAFWRDAFTLRRCATPPPPAGKLAEAKESSLGGANEEPAGAALLAPVVCPTFLHAVAAQVLATGAIGGGGQGYIDREIVN
jgi:hypothetical protein